MLTRPLILTAVVLLLAMMFLLAGGGALRESVTFDEVAHIGAGGSYWQRLELRYNPEHPPLAKALAALPLVMRGVHADYSGAIWKISEQFFPAFMAQWIFGEYVLTRSNDPQMVLAWARFPMLILTIALGWLVFACARRIGAGPLVRHHRILESRPPSRHASACQVTLTEPLRPRRRITSCPR